MSVRKTPSTVLQNELGLVGKRLSKISKSCFHMEDTTETKLNFLRFPTAFPTVGNAPAEYEMNATPRTKIAPLHPKSPNTVD